MISKIKLKNHYLLDDIELDFKKNDEEIYNTIVLAGENGTGKTTILELLFRFLNLESFEYFDYIEYKIGKKKLKVYNTGNIQEASWGFHNRINITTGEIKHIQTNRSNNFSKIENDLDDIRHYGFAYSKARTGFETKKITSTKTEQIDSNKYEEDAKNNNDFTSIKQLIVDIDTQDNAEWMEICRSDKPIKIETFNTKCKMYRFKNAFNNFFDTIKFDHVDNTNPSEKRIIFKKNGKEIDIDNLSTGEKQIVFRGTYLLKNINGITNGIVLIDEPELSLHPRWQERIIEYYRKMFSKNGVQNVQIIIATHSEYIIKSALEDKDNILIITLSDDNGKIHTKRITSPCVLPSITSAEINYLTFGIVSNDYHNQLYGYLQNKNKLYTVKKTDTFIFDKLKQANKHLVKHSSYCAIEYKTLTTYIRNKIDHPDFTKETFTKEELEKSINFLIELCNL